jgi:hypothetical protein
MNLKADKIKGTPDHMISPGLHLLHEMALPRVLFQYITKGTLDMKLLSLIAHITTKHNQQTISLMAYVKTAEQKELNSNVMYRKRK